MGWARTLLLGDIGNRLDIADTEADIHHIQRTQQRVETALSEKDRQISTLTDELGRQKLAIQALTRFLIEKQMIDASQLADFISQVDGKMAWSMEKWRLIQRPGVSIFPRKRSPMGSSKNSETNN